MEIDSESIKKLQNMESCGCGNVKECFLFENFSN